MKIWVYNQDFEMQGVVESYISLTWEEAYQGRGVFTLVAVDSAENIALLQENRLLYMTDKKTAMIIRHRRFDSLRRTIEVNGYTSLDMLSQRGLLGTKIIANAEQGMREIVGQNLRGLDSIALSEPRGFTEIFTAQYSNKEILSILPEISAATELGIRMLFDHKNRHHVFEVYKGLDRTFGQDINPTAFFGDQWGNLSSMVIVDDVSTFRNVAYVFGSGEEDARIMVEVGDAQGIDRFELFVDARDLQPTEGQLEEIYRELLAARGIAKLNEHMRRSSFQAEVDARDFGVKYDLGDKITCKSLKYGVQLNTRIMQFKQVVESNVSKIYLTLGQPEITAIGELRLWLK